MSVDLVCQFCDGYGTERCTHCDDGHNECGHCEGTGGNPLAIDIKGFKTAAKDCTRILKDGESYSVLGTVSGRKSDNGKKQVRYAEYVFQGAAGGLTPLVEDLP